MANKKKSKRQRKETVLIKFFRLNRKLRVPFLSILLLLMIASTAALGYLCWYILLPSLWNWGFNPTTWRSIFSVLGAIYLVGGPFVPFMGISIAGDVINLYLSEQEDEVHGKFAELNKRQSGIEEELIKNDDAGLIPLIRYSRLQLEAYYSIGLSQTQRSFKYSIIAMWIGFIVIISGVTIHFLPTHIRESFAVSNVKEISIAGGTVIEIISALFLWVYRSSINQLTYFYNRQMGNHSVLICQRIAETMQKADETKRIIVEKILEHGQKPEQREVRIPKYTKIVKPK